MGNLRPGFTLRDAARIPFRHAGKIALVVGVTLAVTVAGIVFLPRTYVSQGKLFVRVGRETIGLDPTADAGQAIQLHESRETEINSALDLLNSRALAEQVVDRLGPETILRSGEPQADSRTESPWIAKAARAYQWLRDLDPVNQRERAIHRLRENLKIDAPRKSNVITIGCEADSPELAQRIVQTLIDSYLDDHVRLNHTSGSYEFLKQQEEVLRRQLEAAQQRLQDAKNRFGLISVDGERERIEQTLLALQQQRLANETALATTAAEIEGLQQELQSLPEKLVVDETRGFPHEAADHMRELLYQLEVQEQGLRAKYQDDHPLVIALQEQVRQSRRILNQQETSRVQSSTATNPVYEELFTELLSRRAALQALQAGTASLEQQLAALQAERKALNEQESHLANLQRDVDVLEIAYRDHAHRLEQGRLIAALEKERISNINIAQPASLVVKPVRPNKTLLLALGFLAAFFGAITVALAAEMLDQSLKTPEQVEQELALPVLMSIPRVSRRVSLLN